MKYKILIQNPKAFKEFKIGEVTHPFIWKKITIKEQGQINCVNNVIKVYFNNDRDKYDLVRTVILMNDTPDKRKELFSVRKKKGVLS